MANHDFGSPCSCQECCTDYRDEPCAHCGFKNTLMNVGTPTRTQDRKGTRGYDVEHATSPRKDMVCHKCGKATPKVAFFTAVDKEACARSLQRERIAVKARPCDRCAERVEFEKDKYRAIALKKFDNRQLCAKCLPLEMETKTVDPSDKSNKYRFDRHSLKWELEKVRKSCAKCGRARWLTIGNAWRKLCGKCYLDGRSS
jgi:hypothetical protein